MTALILPADVQEMEYTPPELDFKMVPGSLGYTEPRVLPPEAEVRRAADVLNDGERVAILVGQGARRAADEVVEVAERLGAGVAKALLGKDVLPDGLPFVTGSIGLLGTKPSYEMMMGCDTLLMVGSNLPYSQFLPEFGQARGVQIDIDAKMIGLRYPMEVNLVVAAVWDEALSGDVPVVVDAIVDPEVPPLPPHVEFDDVKHMVSAVLKGDPNAAHVVKQTFKGKAQEFLQ